MIPLGGNFKIITMLHRYPKLISQIAKHVIYYIQTTINQRAQEGLAMCNRVTHLK